MKRIDWKRVARAVKAGVPADQLYRYTGIFNITHLPGTRSVSGDEPFEILRGGTGFMLIERRVFEELASHVSTYTNRNPGTAMPAGATVHHFFPSEIEDGDLRSEDYGLCDLWRKAGGTIWAAPWCELQHMGDYAFSGVYRDSFAVAGFRE